MVSAPLKSGVALSSEAFRELRLQMIFEYCKWDPQVGDQSILSGYPLIVTEEGWNQVSSLASRLACEVLEAEKELSSRPKLCRELGIRWMTRLALPGPSSPSIGMARLIRFDFHFTTEGWRISEANTDVPGGFNEATGMPILMAPHCKDLRPTGNPTDALALAISKAVPEQSLVALVHATAYTDDRQVMEYLAEMLHTKGLRTCLVAPDQLMWGDKRAHVLLNRCKEQLGGIARFFPAEWLQNLPRCSGWQYFFGNSQTPISNPATAMVTQSKRFPLCWDRLKTSLATWHELLPETRHPMDVACQDVDEWVYKPVFGRVGESIGMSGVTSPAFLKTIQKEVRRNPNQWVAQRRFSTLPIETPEGLRYPCLGVYVVDGVVCGAYGRLSRTPLVNCFATDAAVLMERSSTATILKSNSTIAA